MPRVHPLVLPSGRWILPLYSDTFSASIMAISDDRGETWTASRPLIGFGNIQPSLVRKNDGELVAFMRDNGPHHRIRLSTFARRRRIVVAGGRFPLSQPRRRASRRSGWRTATGPWSTTICRAGGTRWPSQLSDDEGSELEVDAARRAQRTRQGSVSLSVDTCRPPTARSTSLTRRAGPGRGARSSTPGSTRPGSWRATRE